jgi:NhaA family Na+:H+ antiporter
VDEAQKTMNSSFVTAFFKLESASAMMLMFAALLAIILANSPLYALLPDTPLEVRVGALQIAKPLLLWINDGLMVIFFCNYSPPLQSL